MPDAVLFPTPAVALMYENDPRFEGFDGHKFYVSEGARKIEGARFRDIWISWWCFEVPGYSDCVHRIQHNLSICADGPGTATLF